MIIQALSEYYERLHQDPEITIPEFGFTANKAHFAIVMDLDGHFVSIEDIRITQKKGKPRPQMLILPDIGGRSGTSIKPLPFSDNVKYVFGLDTKAKDQKRPREMYEAFRSFHAEINKAAPTESLQRLIICLSELPCGSLPSCNLIDPEELLAGNFVFRVQGETKYLHEKPYVRHTWDTFISNQPHEGVSGHCLLSNATAPIARLHPLLKGVAGSQSTGAAIVSFNNTAFESFNKSQSYNAPISELMTFQYTTSLNHLLASNQQRLLLADTTFVFWTEAKTEVESWLSAFVTGFSTSENEEQKQTIQTFLKRARDGKAVNNLPDADTPFFLLGLAPNNARISIRYWMKSSVLALYQNLQSHIQDISVIGIPEDRYPSLYTLLKETVRDTKDIPPLMLSPLLNAILNGSLYPDMFANAIIRRIRADRHINATRAGILKAWLNRLHRTHPNTLSKEIDTMLDPERPEIAYQIGRLFATLERAQETASGGKLNSTIKDRYYSSASATPRAVFSRLLRLHQHHAAKLSGGIKVNNEKLVGEIMSCINDFPANLNSRDQGLFAIGYYQQRQDFFTKKATTAESE